MKHTKKSLFTLLLMTFICASIFAQHPLVRNFTRIDYQGGKQNWCIVQNQDNKMYFANNSGLLEYDSNIWQLYPIANYTNVRSLMYDEESKRIYAGAFNEFGYYQYNHQTLKLEYYSLVDSVPEKERNFNEVWNIYKNDKNIYFQSDRKIFKCDENGKMSIYPFKHKIEKSAIIYNTPVITSIQDGAWTLNNGMLLKLPNSDILKDKKVTAILPYEGTKILFATALDGLFLFDGEKVIAYQNDLTDFLKENQVFCATAKDNKIAFGTVLNGVVVKDLSTNINTYINTYSGLQNNTVLSIKFDNDNNLWLGLDKGIDYVLINSPIKNLFSTNNLYGSGYASLIKDNILYLGTNQGLYITDYPIRNTPDPFQLELVKHMQSQVWSLKEIDNTIFCGNDQGAFIINGSQAQRIASAHATWTFKRLKKHPEYILANSYQGFYILKKVDGKWVFSHYIKGFSESGGMYEEDENGDIWFGHWMKGIYRLKLNETFTQVVHTDLYNHTNGFPSSHNNIICRIQNELFFSSENGFYKYNKKDNNIVPYPKMNEIFAPHYRSVRFFETPDKDIWSISGTSIAMASYQGDGNYILDSLSYKSLLDKLMLGFEHFNFISRNKVLVGTEDGFAYIDIGKPYYSDKKSNIFIRSLFSINKNDTLLYSKSESTEDVKAIKIPYNLNSLRFEFVLPEYQDKLAVEYSYYLKNYDTQWSIYSSQNIKEYTKLKKGDYTFHVKGYNKIDGSISETSFRFTILPPWYESNLAYAIYVIILTLLIYTLVFYINKKSQSAALKIKREKEKQLKEQKEHFLAQAKEKEKEIVELKNQQLEYDLKHKSQELADSTMNLIRKNEILSEIGNDINAISEEIKKEEGITVAYKKLQLILDNIRQNIAHDSDWKRFEQSFDIVYENYLKRLGEQYPLLNTNDKKLCAYLKMDLSSKDIAPLLNMSVRSVETARYRLRKKLGLSRDANLTEFLQRF